jgi:hypothetical protein
MEIDNVPCFLCHDTPNVLYKLCECLESNICVDCYNIDNTQNMIRCPICRRDFIFNYKRNYGEFTKDVLYIVLLFISIISIELFPPLHIYYTSNESQTINGLFISICLFFITIGNIILVDLVKKIILIGDNPIKIITMLYLVKEGFLLILFFIINYNDRINAIIYYIVFVIGIIYVMPLLFFSIIFMFDNFDELKKYINNKSQLRKIAIKSFIFNTYREQIENQHIHVHEPVQKIYL